MAHVVNIEKGSMKAQNSIIRSIVGCHGKKRILRPHPRLRQMVGKTGLSPAAHGFSILPMRMSRPVDGTLSVVMAALWPFIFPTGPGL
jgi:hypothetical protein